MNEINIKELKNFLNYLQTEKYFAKNTLESYKIDLEVFFSMLNKNYDDITEEDILEHIEILREKYTQNTVNRKVTTYKKFFKYLYKNKKIKKLITENIKNLRQINYIPESLSKLDIKRIIENCDNDKKGARDKLVIYLLINTGLLISEILSIKKSDIVDKKYLKYSHKKYPKMIELQNDTLELLDEFIEKNNIEDNDYIFLGLTRQNFAARLKKYVKKAGINRNIYPNMFRNTLALDLLEKGEDIKNIKEKLNYINISRAGIYSIRNKKSIKDIYNEIAIGDWDVSENI
ncbi:integrase/recombinase XerD [Hypnocyclicus thermotrophus]|uniref:Integrase/recombinase XerD n=1 Tax=Hypnocyclicus thermotrophus TaxID=1627895 RepID=A0AA46DZE1_9FUSO|nr:tyrosine-type recombinase/integrase [Hypnocyclicus thermotrophus]TDT71740.1 integrase/recombinase XerD [Hypnocyclicus thermotrophus]